ncbi:MAG TPA: transcriptional regulator [Anaerolineae bacterium]|nr:transcriptional regulator [Anaerolineae bacterium]
MAELDPIIHQPVRLRIMAALTALPEDAQMEFVALRDLLKATDGNLGAHLRKLEDAGYVSIEKTFVARKPRTYISVTPKGRSAFEGHVRALRKILEGPSRGTIEPNAQ